MDNKDNFKSFGADEAKEWNEAKKKTMPQPTSQEEAKK